MSATITVVNQLNARLFGPKDHVGFPLLQVNDAVMLSVEFDGPHSYSRAFESIDTGDSVSFVLNGGPASTTLSLTIESAFQRTQTQSNIAVDMTRNVTITALYFIPNWAVAQADYGLQIGSQPIIDLGYAASVA